MLQTLIQRYKDYLLERKIHALYLAFLRASTNDEIKRAWKVYADAINSRSVGQVKRMEQEKGLCR